MVTLLNRDRIIDDTLEGDGRKSYPTSMYHSLIRIHYATYIQEPNKNAVEMGDTLRSVILLILI